MKLWTLVDLINESRSQKCIGMIGYTSSAVPVVYWIERYVLSKQELPCLCLEVVKWPVLWYQYEVSTWRNYITRSKHLDKASFVHFAVFEINFIGNWNRLIITQITIDNHIFEGGLWKPHFCRTLKQTGSQNCVTLSSPSLQRPGTSLLSAEPR
jgi:hypothetical protein